MARYEKTNFLRQNVELDGNAFYDCEFDQCVLTYRGGDIPEMVGCNVRNSQFKFSDGAERTLQFLAALRTGGFAPVVEQIAHALLNPSNSDSTP